MSIRVINGRLTIEFQLRGRRVFRRLPAVATLKDAREIEEKMKRDIFVDADLNGKPAPGVRAELHRIDPSEWTRLAAMLLSAGPVQPKSGVYFLCKRNRLIYIGRSRNVMKRLGAHSVKDFDRIRMIEAPPSKLAKTEEYLIRMLRPSENQHLTGRGRGGTMDGLRSRPRAQSVASCPMGPVAQSVRAGDS